MQICRLQGTHTEKHETLALHLLEQTIKFGLSYISILGFYTSRALEDANHLITNSKSRTRLAKFLENQIFFSLEISGPKVV